MDSWVVDHDYIAATKQSLKALDVQRVSLEREAETLTEELLDDSQGIPMGIDTPLVDREGFPRADIDIYRARTLRGRLAEIRTDHKSLMKEIELHLHQLATLTNPGKFEEGKREYAARMQPKPKPKFDPLTGMWVVKNWDGSVSGIQGGESRSFENLAAEGSGPADAISTSEAEEAQTSLRHEESTLALTAESRPFAQIDSISALSPAEVAGLREGDLIVGFGPLRATSPDIMRDIAALVERSAANNESVEIAVVRDGDSTKRLVRVRLAPRPWNGRGLVGCHILPC